MQRKIIFFIIILFIAGSFWLFYQGDRQIDSNLNKNWWSVSFVDPKSNNLDFVIENHSDSTYFHWKILTNKNKIQESETEIKKGKSQNIRPVDIGIAAGQKITIQVLSGDEKKEIYKNL